MRQQLALGGFSVGFFGRVVDDKGIRTIASAAESLPPETFQVFGDGPLLKEMRAHPGGVRYHGRVEDVASHMNAMDAIVVPSLWEEAFPYSALEAMSLRKPIIASRSGGLPELVSDGVNGLLFDKKDAEGLASCVRQLSTEPDMALQMGTKGQEIQRSQYTVAHMAERMESAYQTLSDRRV